MIWWTTTVVGAASLVEVSKVCNNYLLHAKVCNKWFNGQSCDALSALWLATGHMISDNVYYMANLYKTLAFGIYVLMLVRHTLMLHENV